MTKTPSMLLLGLICLLPQADLSAQNNSRFELTLNDNLIASLKSVGSLQASLNDDAQGKIAAIQIQFAESASEAAAESGVTANVGGNACQISIDDELIALARKQPVRINLPEGAEFSLVLLNYDGLTAQPPTPNNGSGSTTGDNSQAAPLSDPAANNDLYFLHYVKLTENKTISGQMDLSETIKFATKFGEVDISIGQIAGIRFHVDGEDAALVVLKNGDSITGVPETDTFMLNTDWGRAEIDPTYVEAITTSQNAQFRQSTEPGFGPRWQLIGR